MLRNIFYAACMLASMSDAVNITAVNPMSGESVHGSELSQVDQPKISETGRNENKRISAENPDIKPKA